VAQSGEARDRWRQPPLPSLAQRVRAAFPARPAHPIPATVHRRNHPHHTYTYAQPSLPRWRHRWRQRARAAPILAPSSACLAEWRRQAGTAPAGAVGCVHCPHEHAPRPIGHNNRAPFQRHTPRAVDNGVIEHKPWPPAPTLACTAHRLHPTIHSPLARHTRERTHTIPAPLAPPRARRALPIGANERTPRPFAHYRARALPTGADERVRFPLAPSAAPLRQRMCACLPICAAGRNQRPLAPTSARAALWRHRARVLSIGATERGAGPCVPTRARPAQYQHARVCAACA
jgi:hypothetical protein